MPISYGTELGTQSSSQLQLPTEFTGEPFPIPDAHLRQPLGTHVQTSSGKQTPVRAHHSPADRTRLQTLIDSFEVGSVCMSTSQVLLLPGPH